MASHPRSKSQSDSLSGHDGTSTLFRNRRRTEAASRRRLNSAVSARRLRVSVDSIIGSIMRKRRGTGQGQSPERANQQASPDWTPESPRVGVTADDGMRRQHSLDSSRDSFVAESLNNGAPNGLYPERTVSTPHPNPLPWGETPGSQADSEETKMRRHSIDIGLHQRAIMRHYSNHRQCNIISEADVIAHQRSRREASRTKREIVTSHGSPMMSSEGSGVLETGPCGHRRKPVLRAYSSSLQSGRVSLCPSSSTSRLKGSKNNAFRNDDDSTSVACWPTLKCDASSSVVDNFSKGARLSRNKPMAIGPAGRSKPRRCRTFRSIRSSSTDSSGLRRRNTFGALVTTPLLTAI